MKKILIFLLLVPAICFADQNVIKFLVGFAPGGGQYITTKIISDAASRNGYKNVLMFKEGAGGIIGMNECEALYDDKNLICMATQAQYAHSVVLSDSVRKYNPNDLTYVRAIGSSVTVLVTHPDNNRSVKDVITHITTDKVTFASGALGLKVLTNYVTIQLGSKDAVIVDYRGTGPLLADIYGKNVDYAFIPYAVAKNPHMQGQLRIVGAVGEDDLVEPNLQKFIPNLDSDVTVFGFVMSSKADRENVDKFTRILNELVRDPLLVEQMKTQGINTNDKRINRLSFQEFARLERQKLAKQLLLMPKN